MNGNSWERHYMCIIILDVLYLNVTVPNLLAAVGVQSKKLNETISHSSSLNYFAVLTIIKIVFIQWRLGNYILHVIIQFWTPTNLKNFKHCLFVQLHNFNQGSRLALCHAVGPYSVDYTHFTWDSHTHTRWRRCIPRSGNQHQNPSYSPYTVYGSSCYIHRSDACVQSILPVNHLNIKLLHPQYGMFDYTNNSL